MNKIYLYSSKELDSLRRAAGITAQIIGKIKTVIAAGMSTKDVDDYAADMMEQYGVKPAFLGYRGYPARICVSIDGEVVHGIPSKKRILENGQIVSIDIGVVCDGFIGDMAYTIPVGEISVDKKRLLSVTEQSLDDAVKFCKEGFRLGDVSHAVQKRAEENGFSVVRDFVGHGVGRNMHEEPQIPNYGVPCTGIRLKKGMVFALEPMINMGTHEVNVMKDGWTVVTKDGQPSAHFEKMVAVGQDEPMLLSEFR